MRWSRVRVVAMINMGFDLVSGVWDPDMEKGMCKCKDMMEENRMTQTRYTDI